MTFSISKSFNAFVLAGAVALAAPFAASASSGELRLERAPVNVDNYASLQSGARTFVNQCLNCHSAASMRYSKLSEIGLTEAQIKDNLLFAGDRVGELMVAALPKKDAKESFGAVPPDLSVVARARGADWLYTYMRAFYRDPNTVTGWNNLAFPGVAMPHVLWTLQGQPVLETREFEDHAKAEAALIASRTFAVLEEHGAGKEKRYLVKTAKLDKPGSQDAVQYEATVRDLVNFLVWMGEPAQSGRKTIGMVVLLVLSLLIGISWMLKRNFWKDVH